MNSSLDRSVEMTAVIGRGGERLRFEALCLPFRTDLLRFVYWLCRDRSLAEDVVQEALLRAWRSFDSLADEQAARSWLLTIARRELARHFERAAVETSRHGAPGAGVLARRVERAAQAGQREGRRGVPR